MSFWEIINLSFSKFNKKFKSLSSEDKIKFMNLYYKKYNKLYKTVCKGKHICKRLGSKDHCIYVIEQLGKSEYNNLLKKGKLPTKLKKIKRPKYIIFYMY